MKNRRMISRMIAVVTLFAVALTCTALFAACNKSKPKGIADIFNSRENFGELTSSKLEFTLPAGWEVYTDSDPSTSSSSSSKDYEKNSDVGYIPELDAFIVSQKAGSSTKLSIVKCGDETKYNDELIAGMMFHPSQGISALRFKDGLVACLFDDGTAGAFDAKTGREVLSRSKLGKAEGKDSTGYSDTSGANIDSVIKILCAGLIAVHYDYDHDGQSGYVSIYRPTYDGDIENRGELVCRIKSSVGLSQVDGFDGKYATVSGTSNGEYIFRVPDHAPSGGAQSIESTSRGTFTTNSKTNYTDEVTYLGNGKFFVCQDWEVSEGTDYAYYKDGKYVDLRHGVYNADSDAFREVGKDKIFNDLTNNRYKKRSNVSVDVSPYLKDGYTYVTYGLTIYESGGKKLGRYDQFIIDSDLNVVMSLSDNFGVTVKDQKKGNVECFDLLMYGVDGKYYSPNKQSAMNVYDAGGKLLWHDDRSAVTKQEFNSNIMAVEMPGTSSSSSLFGAYDAVGNLIVPFDYDMLKTYRGAYTLGRRYGKSGNEGESTSTRYLRLIGADGKEIAEAEMIDKNGNITTAKPFSDMAYNSSSSTSITYAACEMGCYMFRVDMGEGSGDSRYKYGVRNYSPKYHDSVIIPATMAAGSKLYSCLSSPSDLFVFEKQEGKTGDITFAVYRLI